MNIIKGDTRTLDNDSCLGFNLFVMLCFAGALAFGAILTWRT